MDFIKNVVETLSNDDLDVLKKKYLLDCEHCGGGGRNFADELNIITKPDVELDLSYVIGYSNLYKTLIQILVGEVRKYIMKDFWEYLQESKQILDVNEAYFLMTNKLVLIQTNLNRCIDNPDNQEDIFNKNLELFVLTIEEIQDTFANVKNLSKWIYKNIVLTNKQYTRFSKKTQET